ncbi:thiopurine S-methyltransferase [Pseudomonas guineae]|uniref:Thiopurine S-methyltransferase n=1 Tax=Pseudomonas guineae TaxID=425504 RepID=A0A1I3CH17_9PSED|nr:thiopurine S-methyltransferase [Pseudomonas guineae]SFH73832.1 thiopurine S-methyltransferase [Pseudomonas guineae]
MHAEFWQTRWSRSEIGFHLAEVNPYLQRYWPALGLAEGARVLVPLCGKSLDLAWLAAQGYQVIGVELAQRAVEDFFTEHELQPVVSEVGAFRCYQAGNVEIYCGDFFALSAQQLVGCVGLYDRAALIALPAPMRERYVAHLTQVLPAGCQGLLVTLDYDQGQMEGPPFAVADDEVQRLFAAHWQLQHLASANVLGDNWRFLKRGLERLDERVYRLDKN